MSVPLVLLPGLDGTGDLFEPFLAELPSFFRPIVLRYPRTGAQDYATLVRFVQKQLPDESGYVLLAESFSGPVAVLVAASNPADVGGIILCASFVKSPRRLGRALALLSRVLPLHLLSRIGGPHALMGRFRTPKLARLLKHSVAQVSQKVMSERYRAVAHVDVRAELRKLTIPALYLRASEDAVVPASAAEIFSRSCAGAKVRVVEAPHFLLQCAPSAAAREVEEFVRHRCV